MEEIIELKEDVSQSPLYSDDLAPVPASKRTWNVLNLAAIWVGMAVCIPTYILASYMIKSGLSWQSAILIIGLANLLITVPMILNGHAGVKYGIPFPVYGRASFGTKGIHIPSIVRAIVACGWFGVQTWIGGLAFYAIWNAVTGSEGELGLSIGKFIGFGLFWLLNVFFIWKGTDSIKKLEDYTAPILILIGMILIAWGTVQAGGFGVVLDQSKQLERQTAVLLQDDGGDLFLELTPLLQSDNSVKCDEFQISIPTINDSIIQLNWVGISSPKFVIRNFPEEMDFDALFAGTKNIQVQFKKEKFLSSIIHVSFSSANKSDSKNQWWQYILWLTAMVGFWATMSLSISDITRYAKTQNDQIKGQLIGLPGTMILYSFVGIFVTCAAVINFEDVLISSDAPWDPVTLLSKFNNPIIVIIAQVFMVIATLSTNIAANVIAPANSFSNLIPQKISFRAGGIITAIIGIIICPWWLLGEISGVLIFVSGLLGPVLGILLSDYYLIRRKKLELAELYKNKGIYAYGGSGLNSAAMIALFVGVFVAIIGFFVPSLAFLYNLSWFTGFIASFIVYYQLMKNVNIN